MNLKSSGKINEYIAVALRRKWMLGIPTVAGLLAGAVLSLFLPSYYKSTTIIFVEQQQIPEKYVTSSDVTPIEKRLNSIGQQILSRANLEKIVDDFKLQKEFSALPSPSNPFFIPFRMMKLLDVRPSGKEETINLLRSRVEVKIEGNQKRGDAFTISYSGTNPYSVMQITSTLASLFVEENLRIREQSVEGTSEFLKNELDSAKSELETQEKNLRGFKERNIGSLPEQLDTNLRTLDRLQLELQSVRSALKSTEDRKAMIEEQFGFANDAGAGNPDLEAELDSLKKDLDKQLSIFSDTYPDVVITKKRIAEVEAALSKPRANKPAAKKISSREYAELISQGAILKQNEAELKLQIKSLERRVDFTPANEQKHAELKRDYDISLQNYRTLLEKKLNARLAENLEKWQKGERFRVIDPPNLPEKPYKPDKLQIVFMGLIAGLLVGAGLVYIFEYLNPAFTSSDGIQEVLELPVMAMIPFFEEDKPQKASNRIKLIKGRRT